MHCLIIGSKCIVKVYYTTHKVQHSFLTSLSTTVSSSLASLTFFPHFLPLSLPPLLTSLTFFHCLFLPYFPHFLLLSLPPLLSSLFPAVSSSLTFLPLSQQVSAALVYGRATHIVWPPHRLQRLSSSLSSDQHHRRNQGLSYQLI